MRASRPRMERFAPISSAVGNTPATTRRRSAFPAPQSRRQAVRPRPGRRRMAPITSTLPAPSSSSPASPLARQSLFSIFSTPRAIACRPISPIRTSAASASTHSTTPPSLGTAGARVLDRGRNVLRPADQRSQCGAARWRDRRFRQVCSRARAHEDFIDIVGQAQRFYAWPTQQISIAAPPRREISGPIFPILAAGGPTNSPWNNAGLLVPDIAGNVRVDQPWGAAQVMGALHDDRARYYNATANGVISGVAHPADAGRWPPALACA